MNKLHQIQTNEDLIYLKLNPHEQEIFEKAKLSEGHAQILLKVHSEKNRAVILEYIVRKKLNVIQTQHLYEKLFFQKAKQSKKERLPSDVRLYINTINNIVNRMTSAGIQAQSLKKETDEYIECIIRIPKSS